MFCFEFTTNELLIFFISYYYLYVSKLIIRFSSGLESASFVASSNLLKRPVETILELYTEINPKQDEENLFLKVKQELDLTIIAFVTTPINNLQASDQLDLISSLALRENNFPVFEFLCNNKFPCFSLHKAAISLFYHHREQLHQLKSRVLPLTKINQNKIW